MSTPTGTNPNDLRDTETIGQRARDVSDLDRLEAMLLELEGEQWAPHLPRAAQLPPVPGLASPDGRSGGHHWSPLSLQPEHLVPPAALMLSHDGPRWPLGILIAGICALPIAYYFTIGAWHPLSAPGPQLASVETKRVVPSAPSQKGPPIRAQDDEAESSDANEMSLQRVAAPRAAKFPERDVVAMLQPEDPGIRALSPQQAVRALGPEEISLLTKQGEQFAETGDFATARMLFQRAAEGNDATAATALGATYDPTVLAGLRAVGVDADVVKARFWYQKAVSLGSSDAKRRLDLLANR